MTHTRAPRLGREVELGNRNFPRTFAMDPADIVCLLSPDSMSHTSAGMLDGNSVSNSGFPLGDRKPQRKQEAPKRKEPMQVSFNVAFKRSPRLPRQGGRVKRRVGPACVTLTRCMPCAHVHAAVVVCGPRCRRRSDR